MNYELIVELLQNEVLELRVKLQEARATIELRGQSVAALSRYCDEDRGTIAKLQEHNNELQSELESSKLDAKIWYENYDALLQSCEQLQSEKTNLLLHRNSLQAENNKLILERDQLQTDCERLVAGRDELRNDTARLAKNWDDCENKLKELQIEKDVSLVPYIQQLDRLEREAIVFRNFLSTIPAHILINDVGEITRIVMKEEPK